MPEDITGGAAGCLVGRGQRHCPQRITHSKAPLQRILQPRMPVVPMLRDPASDGAGTCLELETQRYFPVQPPCSKWDCSSSGRQQHDSLTPLLNNTTHYLDPRNAGTQCSRSKTPRRMSQKTPNKNPQQENCVPAPNPQRTFTDVHESPTQVCRR